MRGAFADAGKPIALYMIDIDYFKQVNDRYSHCAGDRELAQVAALLKAQCRDGDFVVRYGGEGGEGGEEFVVALPGFARDHVVFAAERLRSAAADHRLYLAKSGGRDRVVAGPAAK